MSNFDARDGEGGFDTRDEVGAGGVALAGSSVAVSSAAVEVDTPPDALVRLKKAQSDSARIAYQ